MTEEEKKDLEYIKESPTSREIMLLRIISKLQEENKELREGKDTAENELKSQLEENKKLQSDIEIKDKVIDYLAEKLEEKSKSMTKGKWKIVAYNQVEKVEEEK